ncbi:uncharacterized protein [Aegilops tauschii subsp. strangulata]|uniref:uncharacterized protein n=1 Tax=Aegilops tauschii subsp. strangulata TaxID=200361 RepID=UPI00098B4DA3|nr:uncharacterized protein LOC109770400 [Aegilops tauschii subsp. strangulata]
MSLVPYAGGSGSPLPTFVPVLTSDNYTTWAIKVEANLDMVVLWEMVVSTEDAALAVVAKKDKPAQAYLLGALSEKLLMQVSAKKTAVEVWASLKTRFVGADQVQAARLATLPDEFEHLRIAEGESLDAFAGKIGGMAARYAGLGTMLGDAEMVKKLLDSVLDRLYAAVTGIEQFCNVDKVPFEEVLRGLKAFKERTKRRGCGNDQLMLTVAQWAARWRQHGGGFDHDNDGGGSMVSGGAGKRQGRRRYYNCGEREHFWWECPKRQKAQAPEQALLADIDDVGPILL